MPELVAGCDIILGNEEDAEKVFGIKPEGFDAAATEGEVHAASFQSVCTQLMAHFPRARKVIITLRGSINANHNTWGGVLYADNRLYESRRYDITHIVAIRLWEVLFTVCSPTPVTTRKPWTSR